FCLHFVVTYRKSRNAIFASLAGDCGPPDPRLSVRDRHRRPGQDSSTPIPHCAQNGPSVDLRRRALPCDHNQDKRNRNSKQNPNTESLPGSHVESPLPLQTCWPKSETFAEV